LVPTTQSEAVGKKVIWRKGRQGRKGAPAISDRRDGEMGREGNYKCGGGESERGLEGKQRESTVFAGK